ncbi:MAG: Ig-like domain-containing protein [Lachnospiraceae bacterium]|nr:Ig-like domain-containing protein [Lachnospiraceae bacterium]
MKIKQWLRTALAGTMAFAMVATSLPVNTYAEEAETVNPIMHWNMTQDEDGSIKDLSGNGHNGVTNGSVAFSTIDEIPVLDMTGGYVDIPDGTISESATEVTINMLVKISRNIKSSWMFCIGSDNKKYMYITGSSNQDNNMRAGVGNAPANGNGWNYESVVVGSQPLAASEWQNVTLTCKDGGSFTFYLNGEKQNSIAISEGAANNDTTCTLQGLMTAGDARDGYMGWSFYEANDPKFEGAVADFRIYEKELSEEEVAALSTEMNDMLASLKENDFGEADINLTEADCLGTNTSADEITSNLVLPTKTTIGINQREAQITKWVSSNPDAISETGEVTQKAKKQEVTMTASVTLKDRTVDKELKFTVLGNASNQEIAESDAKDILIPNMDDIRGNITLSTKGELGSKIAWTSSNEAVISTTKNGKVAAGKVNRQAEDTKVTLTATVTYGEGTVTKSFDCVVKKAAGEIELTDYLFAYFPYTSTKDERIYFGISEDGTNFEALNNGKFVLESKLGTHGLRDPFIIRSPEGDKFYLIATDLTVAGVEQDGVNYPGQNWNQNQVNGSQSIMVWESTDLVNWSEQRMCKVAVDNAGCTWAPEAYWDDATEQYVVFWASKCGDDGYAKQRVYYATTRDFYTFSDAKVWIDGEVGSVIDTTVIKVGDYYYRYTKNEHGSTNEHGTPKKRIFCERSKTLTSANWELVYADSLNVGGGQIEGGCISQINPEDVETVKQYAALQGIELKGNEIYCLSADQTGSTVFIGLSDNIEDGWFNVLGTSKSQTVDGVTIYTMPEPDASHGTIMPITSEEYDKLMKAYNENYAVDASGYAEDLAKAAEEVKVDTAVTGNITLPTTTTNGATVVWTSSNEAVVSAAGVVTRPETAAGDATVELTATITVKGNETVRDQVTRKSFTVTVKAKEAATVTPPTEQAEETAIKLNISKATIGVKEKVKLAATVTGKGKDQAVTWNSNKPNIVKVDAKGNIQGKKTGTATITATVDGKSVTCKITVKAAPKKITVKAGKTTLKKGKTTQIKVKKYTPAKAASYKLTFKSSNKKVATVSATGKVTAKKKGTAKITVTTYNKKKATIKIRVK